MSKLQINSLIIKDKNKFLVDIKDINIDLSLALVGQSGSGKSLTLKAFLGMLPSNLQKEFDYRCDFELCKKNIGYVPQNPFTSLSPLTKITKQFFCPIDKQIELLKLVDVDINSLDKFPMQLSGGQLQRIIIAMALSHYPKILLLDEPTTALDIKNKKIILDILHKITKQFNLKILFVTHDIISVKDICDDIVVLKDGLICEKGEMSKIINNPTHNYTKQLLEANFENRKFRV
jgi:peptide/nickel transport system ATP-binding protein